MQSQRLEDCTREKFWQWVDAPETAAACAAIEGMRLQVRLGMMSREEYETKKGEQKRRLPVITPQGRSRTGHRRTADMAPTGLVMLDVDHVEEPRQLWAKIRQKMEANAPAGEAGDLGILLAYVTPSLEGLRLVFRQPRGLSISEAQRRMAETLDIGEYDTCVKDIARCSFLVPRSYILFIDEERLFKADATPEAQDETTVSKELSTSNSPIGSAASPVEELSTLNSQLSTPSPSFRGIPYADIIREFWLRTGGEPQQGERNVRLHKLCVALRTICDNSRSWVLSIVPRLGLSEQEVAGIVDSACKEPPKGMTKLITEIVDDLQKRRDTAEPSDEEVAENAQPAINPRKLPQGLRESLVGVPENMRMAVLCAVLPIAAAYADGVEVEYCDGKRMHLGLMTIVAGEQASGKSVCASAVNVWKQPMEEADRQARQTEEEWRRKCKSRKANEKAPEDPRVVIRYLPLTISCTTLLRRLKYAEGHTLCSFGEELDTLRKTNGAGSWSAKYDIYRQAFDRSQWGQDYNSDQAESGVVDVAYNWTVLGTYGALARCFSRDNIENGLSSRILLATMPECPFARMPRYGHRTEEQEAAIHRAAARLSALRGYINTPRLRRAMDRWVEEKRQLAAKNIDRVMDTYRKRAAVIGFRAGVVYHLLTEGQEQSEEGILLPPRREMQGAVGFALTVAEYCLQNQMRVFGAEARRHLTPEAKAQHSEGNSPVFDKLPSVFSIDDLRRLKPNVSVSALYMTVSRWRKDGWVEKKSARQWGKVDGAANCPKR